MQAGHVASWRLPEIQSTSQLSRPSQGDKRSGPSILGVLLPSIWVWPGLLGSAGHQVAVVVVWR